MLFCRNILANTSGFDAKSEQVIFDREVQTSDVIEANVQEIMEMKIPP
jgi:hypothetical protein